MPKPLIAHGIIVADNDPLLRGILRSVLANAGFVVFLAADGAEAVEYAHRIRAELVILDLAMPRLNGFDACERIRVLPEYAHVPIAILTVYDRWDTREAARRAGASLFVSKPFRPGDLLQAVVSLIGAARSTRPDEAHTPALVWERREEKRPGLDAPELARGRNVLDVYRR